MDIFLNRLIRFYLNNTLNLRPVNFTHYAVLYPQNGDRILSDHRLCDVTSPCVLVVAEGYFGHFRLPEQQGDGCE